jgi:hypothetical protein
MTCSPLSIIDSSLARSGATPKRGEHARREVVDQGAAASITVTNADGKIAAMNESACLAFAPEGGAALIGSHCLRGQLCHFGCFLLAANICCSSSLRSPRSAACFSCKPSEILIASMNRSPTSRLSATPMNPAR